MYFVFIDDFVILDLQVGERLEREWFTSYLEAKPRRLAVCCAGTNLVSCPTSIQGYVEPRRPPRCGFEGRPAGRVPEPEGVQVQGWSRLVAVDLDVHEPIPSTQLTWDQTVVKNTLISSLSDKGRQQVSGEQ